MRIPSALSLFSVAALAACGMDTTSPDVASTAIAPAEASFRRSTNSVGQVFTMSNAVAGNAVLAFSRSADGSLRAVGTYATRGTGTGAGLGNQGGVALDEDGNTLVVVNAGSNEITAFRVRDNGSLDFIDKASSGGTMPISVTISRDLVYVLNAGGTGNIAGFELDHGRLSPLRNSSRPLGGTAVGPAQISFDPSGKNLVVTEKATNRLTTYSVDRHGLASAPTTTASSGTTPFGFAFTNSGALIVSEAFGGAPDGSAVSSYALASNDRWAAVSASVPTTETAACWIAVTENGKFAYTTNAGSGTITGYAVKRGALDRLDADGVTANIGAGSAPSEMAFSRNSKFLYTLAGGLHSIVAYSVSNDGSLTPIGGGVTGLPNAANGLAAR